MSIFEEYGAFKAFVIFVEYLRFGLDIVRNYSRTSLSRTRLFRITAYLEVKIWSLF